MRAPGRLTAPDARLVLFRLMEDLLLAPAALAAEGLAPEDVTELEALARDLRASIVRARQAQGPGPALQAELFQRRLVA